MSSDAGDASPMVYVANVGRRGQVQRALTFCLYVFEDLTREDEKQVKQKLHSNLYPVSDESMRGPTFRAT